MSHNPNNLTYVMENEVFLNRENYPRRKDYLARYHELNNHYDFKSRVEGGWRFFRHLSDYLRWQNAK